MCFAYLHSRYNSPKEYGSGKIGGEITVFLHIVLAVHYRIPYALLFHWRTFLEI